MKDIIRSLSIVGLSLLLTTGVLIGCSTGDANSPSPDTSEQQVEQQSEKNHEHSHEGSGSKHEDDGHHDQEGHEDNHGHERADHFEGKEAKTYDEAISNMTEANSRLDELLAKDELASEDFYKIHRMSYTMENALAVIREEHDGEYEDVAESLESVHLASEKRDVETVRQEGKNYLEGAEVLLEKE